MSQGEELKQKMKEAFRQDNVKLQQALFLMGFTGEGKTTISHVLSGNILMASQDEEDEDNPQLMINPMKEDGRKIAKGLTHSVTTLPNLFTRVKHTPDGSYGPNQGPGLSDSQPQEDLSMSQVLNQSQKSESDFDLKNSAILDGDQQKNLIFGFRHNEFGDIELDAKKENVQEYIWDTPGFHDTNQESKVQEIANQFYNCLLIKNVARAKFLIVTSEASLTSGKQKIFKETLENFAEMFNEKYLDQLDNCVGIIVNKALRLRTEKSVVSALKELLHPDDKSLSPKAKKILKFTVNEAKEGGKYVWTPKTILLYQEILQLGPHADNNGQLYDQIQAKIQKYFEIKEFQVQSSEDIANMVISPEGAQLAQPILQESEAIFNKLFMSLTDYSNLVSDGFINPYHFFEDHISRGMFMNLLIKRAKKKDEIIDKQKMTDEGYQNQVWENRELFQQVKHLDDISCLQTIIEKIYRPSSGLNDFIQCIDEMFKLFLQNSTGQQQDDKLKSLRQEIKESIEFIQFLQRVKYVQNQESKSFGQIDLSLVKQNFNVLSQQLSEMENTCITNFEVKEDLENYDLFNKLRQILELERYQNNDQYSAKRGEVMVQLGFIKRSNTKLSFVFLRKSLYALQRVDRSIPDRSIYQICDSLTKYPEEIKAFKDHKNITYKRIFDEFQSRMALMTCQLIHNIESVTVVAQLPKFGEKKHLKQMRAVISIRNFIYQLQQMQRPQNQNENKNKNKKKKKQMQKANNQQVDCVGECKKMISKLKEIDLYVSEQAGTNELIEEELKRQFDCNSSEIQNNLEKLLLALNFMNEQTGKQHYMFEWMDLFQALMEDLKEDHKRLITNIPCGLLNSEGYTKEELVEVCQMCLGMPNNLQALRTCAETEYCLGKIHVSEGESPEIIETAIFYFKKSLQNDNSLNQSRLEIAQLFFKQKQYEQAVRYYKEIRAYTKMKQCHQLMIEMDFDNPQLKINYGECLREIGMLELAKEQYMEAIGLYNLQFNNTEAKKLYKVVNVITTQQGAPPLIFEQQAHDAESIYPARLQSQIDEANDDLRPLPFILVPPKDQEEEG